MFGFEIACVHKGRRYSEWATISRCGGSWRERGHNRPGRPAARYKRSWIVERDPDRGPIPGGQFGLWVEQVFGGLVPDGGWWLWARIGTRRTETYRLVAEWA